MIVLLAKWRSTNQSNGYGTRLVGLLFAFFHAADHSKMVSAVVFARKNTVFTFANPRFPEFAGLPFHFSIQ